MSYPSPEDKARGEYQDGSLLFVASAIVDRRILEKRERQEAIYQLMGPEPTPQARSKTRLEELLINARRYYLAALLGGKSVDPPEVYAAELVRNLADEDLNEVLIMASRDIGEIGEDEEVDLTSDETKEELELGRQALREGIFSGQKASAEASLLGELELVAMYKAAEELARESGLDVISFFQDDELYATLIRRMYTPEEHAQRAITAAHEFDEGAVIKIKTNNAVIEARSEAIMRDKELPVDEARSIREDVRATADPEEIAEGLRNYQNDMARILEAELQRFWGEGVLAALPAELRQQIEALKPSLTIEEKRAAFVQSYCAARGIKVHQLSMEQIVEINDSPDWQNPR